MRAKSMCEKGGAAKRKLFIIYLPCVIKIVTEVVTLLIIHQIRSSLGGSEGKVEAFEEHKQ